MLNDPGEIRLSCFDHARDGIPKPLVLTWAQFVEMLGGHRFHYGDKKQVPAFSPAEFQTGMPRKESFALRVWFGALDLDMITSGQLAAVCQRLEGLDAVLYTTWTHPEAYETRKLWKVRIVVRFTRPVDAQEWPLTWAAMSAYFCGLNDTNMGSVNEIYFIPSAPPNSNRDLCQFVIFQGRALDPATLPAQTFGHVPITATEKITRERLQRVSVRWKRSRDPYRAEQGEALAQICRGEAFAENGNVDNRLFQLCQDLAKELPNSDPTSLAVHFAQSLPLMAFEGKSAHSIEDITRKLERALEKNAAQTLATEMAKVQEKKQRIRQAFAHIDPEREHGYTPEEVQTIAVACKCTVEELRQRWLIQRTNLFYVLGPNGVYSRAYSDKDIGNAVLRDLAPADGAGGVDLWDMTAAGDPIRKSMAALMGEYGSVAIDHVLDMRAQVSTYESTQKLFIEAPCPLRSLVPTYDPDVAHWLEILMGQHIGDVLNWLSWITDLNLTCAALMMTGKKDTGKSLLAFGLARLWTMNEPTPLTSALDDFNEKLSRCPLVFADEQLPKDFKGNGRTSEIREFLSARSRSFKKKYAPESSIIGAIRLIVAANSDDILAIQEHLSAYDIEAIGDRFYHVQVDPRAADFLRLCDPASFVNQDRIAKHALWLRDHHPKKRDGRFLIKSPNREFYQGLATRSGIRSAVCQWLVGYLRSPNRIDARGDWGVRVRDRKLYVRAETILESWDVFVKERLPTAGVLSRAVGELSSRREHLATTGKGQQWYRQIDTGHLYAWAAQTEFMSRDEIDQALGTDTETRVKTMAQSRSTPAGQRPN